MRSAFSASTFICSSRALTSPYSASGGSNSTRVSFLLLPGLAVVYVMFIPCDGSQHDVMRSSRVSQARLGVNSRHLCVHDLLLDLPPVPNIRNERVGMI